MSEQHKFDELKKLFKNVFEMIEKRFENVPILCSFGNNDMIYNHKLPGKFKDKDFDLTNEDFYKEIFQVWFNDRKGN